MNTPQRPQNPPDTPKPVDHDPGPMQNGVPEGAKENSPEARPSDGRLATETAANQGS